MKKIGLINLKSEGNNYVWNMGLLSIASYLHKYSKHRAEIIDGFWDDPFKVASYNITYDTFGISAMTGTYESACRLGQMLKLTFPSKPLIIGGIHISTLPQSLRPCFDVAIYGEGEQKLLDWLDGNSSLKTERLDLNNYPQLDYDLIDPRYFEKRKLNIWESYGIDAPLLTSRGCPYHCVFCSTSRYWNIVQFFPPTWVVNEIRELANRGATIISIHDDLFSINKKRLRDIADRLDAEGLNKHIKFTCYAKSNTLDDEMCLILKKIGIKIVNFGFESGNSRVLKYLKAGSATIEDHTNAIKLCHKHGIRMVGSFIMGSPGETVLEMLDSIKLAYKAAWYGADSLWHIALTPFPGTPVWENEKLKKTVSDNMDFDDIQFFGDKWRKIPRLIHLLMFFIRAFIKIRRVIRSKI